MAKEQLVRQAAKSLPSRFMTVSEEKAFIEGFTKGAEWMKEKVVEWMINFKNGNDEFPLYDYVGNFRKAFEE